MVDVEIPAVGESISEVQISRWLVAEGDWVAEGDNLVELETEKASVELPAPVSGTVKEIVKKNEDFASIGDIVAKMEPGEKPASQGKADDQSETSNSDESSHSKESSSGGNARVMPAAQRLLDENGLRPEMVTATGPGGRLLKEDVLAHLEKQAPTPVRGSLEVASPVPGKSANSGAAANTDSGTSIATVGGFGGSATGGERREEVKPLSIMRRTIAARLVQAQQTAALLTTFNEVDMEPVMSLRSKYKEAFLERHGVKLGFMSFFTKAACKALEQFPAVNAQIRDNNIVYHNYADIGIAIGSGKGLVVPILRNVETMSFAAIEKTIGDFAHKAGNNQIKPEDLTGGTFTISNGGVYGSMLSTPIVNPPQSAILGLHNIQERPMAVNKQVVVRPMMYLALSYDHRIIDGREAVSFLRSIKETIEDPARLFLEV